MNTEVIVVRNDCVCFQKGFGKLLIIYFAYLSLSFIIITKQGPTALANNKFVSIGLHA